MARSNLDKKLKPGKRTQEQYDKESAKIQKKAAEREKAYAIANAVINTAGAIIGFLAKPSGPAGLALSIAAGITGAAQIATILATNPEGGSTSAPSTSSISGGSETGGTAPSTSFTFADQKGQAPDVKVQKTYVLSKDVDTAQQLERATVANGTL